MKTAIIFPGQGSQFIGMGYDFYQKYNSSKEIYDELDYILREKLTDTIFFGEKEQLSMTENAQPSIMATSIAILSALFYEGLLSKNIIGSVAGHSLGEYSALVANDSLKFFDAVKLLKVRSSAMQESMPVGTGGMVAVIGSSYDQADQIVNNMVSLGKIFIANDNADGQIVLSGEIKAIEYILNNYKDLGLKKAIKLPVSAPFHCRLMEKAFSIMSIEVPKYNFAPFSVPLYSNVTADKCTSNEIVNLLIEQTVSKVRWREIVLNMIRDNFSLFIEVGPGNVLTNLVKRISKEVEVISISKLEDLEKLDKIKV